MSQGIKVTLDFLNTGRIKNLPDGVDPQDAATVAQLGTTSGSGTGSIDGGFPGTRYITTQSVDGGNPSTIFLASQFFNGGTP